MTDVVDGEDEADGALSVEQILGLPPVVSVWPTVALVYGIRKTLTYELAQKDELPVPVLRVGRLLRARRADIIQSLGLADPYTATSSPDAGADPSA